MTSASSVKTPDDGSASSLGMGQSVFLCVRLYLQLVIVIVSCSLLYEVPIFLVLQLYKLGQTALISFTVPASYSLDTVKHLLLTVWM